MNTRQTLRDLAVLVVALFSGVSFLVAFTLAALGVLWIALAVAAIGVALLLLGWRLGGTGP